MVKLIVTDIHITDTVHIWQTIILYMAYNKYWALWYTIFHLSFIIL